MTHHIPRPPGIPVLGNINNINPDLPEESFGLLAKKYGEIYELKILSMFHFLHCS
jgi:cytochrome P450/NADPH-cytochrome P450 reductase